MDRETGYIWERDKINIKNIKGELVEWEVGESVIVKNCAFQVKEIRCFPENEIVLKGRPRISKITIPDIANLFGDD